MRELLSHPSLGLIEGVLLGFVVRGRSGGPMEGSLQAFYWAQIGRASCRERVFRAV